MTDLGYIGERLDLLIRQGADFPVDGALTVTLTYADKEPYDLTGCTISATVKKESDDGPEADMVVDFGDRSAGVFNLTMPHDITATLTCGPTINMAASRYVWQADLTTASGWIIPLYYGDVAVYRDITP